MANDVNIGVTATDKASPILDKVAGNTESMAARSGKAISGLGQKIGGEFGELVSLAGEKLEEFGQHGLSANQKIGVMGVGIAGLGVALGVMGSAEKAATQQLDASVEASGQSIADFSKQIDAAKSKAEDFGHSGADAEQALARLDQTTGDLGVSLRNMALVEDLAAAKHESLAVAAATVAAVLGGNTKVLKQYGIVLSSGAHSTQELQAALDQLAQKLSGQAAAASDTFSGKIDAAKAHAMDFTARIANDVSPAMTFLGTGIGIASGIVDIFGIQIKKMATEQAAAAVALEGESVAATENAVANSEAAVSQDALAVSGDKVALSSKGAGVSGYAAAAGVLAFAAAAGVAGSQINTALEKNNSFVQTLNSQQKTVDTLTQAFQKDGNAIGDNTKQVLQAALQQDGLADKASRSGITIGQLTTALTGGKEKFDELVQSWTKSGKPSGDTLVALRLMYTGVNNLTPSIDTLTDSTNNLSQATFDYADSTGTAVGSIADFTNKLAAQNDALSQAEGKLSDLTGGALDVSSTQDKFVTSTHDLSAALKKNGKDISDNTDGALANRDAIRNSIQAAEAFMVAQEQSGVKVEQATAVFKANMDQLGATAEQAGVTKDDWGKLVDQMNLTPADVFGNALISAALFQESLKQTDQKVLDLLSDLHRVVIPGAVYSGSTLGPQVAQEHGGSIGAAASGGIRGKKVLVGEHGPEIVNLPGGSYVHSNPDSMAMFGGNSGGGNAHVTFDFTGADQELAKAFRKIIRAQGGNVQTVLGS